MDDVQLGFVNSELSHPLALSRQFFPSKVGGKPVWLNPEEFPSIESLTCSLCGNSLRFILQIYAPIEDFERSFHRTLYLFCCLRLSCIQKTGLKVFRCQLKRVNKYYDMDPPILEGNDDYHKTSDPHDVYPNINLCFVCGIPSNKHCAKCQKVNYCSVACQKLDWNAGHNNHCSINHVVNIFPEYEINIEYEEFSDLQENIEIKSMDDTISEKKIENQNDILDAKSILNDENTSVIKDIDTNYDHFQSIIQENPKQVLRYYHYSEISIKDDCIIWVSSPPSISDIPKCQFCNSKRVLEFQVLPQLLYYLNIERLFPNDTPDWGMLAVYTCVQSCGESGHYLEEYVYRQCI